MGFLPYSSDLQKIILKNIKKKNEKKYFRKIINHFSEDNFLIKVKNMIPKKSNPFYRVYCYVKKGEEVLYMDTNENLTIHIRVKNQETFDKLSEYTENIRNRFLNAKNCPTPNSSDCKGSIYHFTFNGTKHIKCKAIYCNFKFFDLNESDFANIMDIIDREIG